MTGGLLALTVLPHPLQLTSCTYLGGKQGEQGRGMRGGAGKSGGQKDGSALSL